jgi:hypothetical protein
VTVPPDEAAPCGCPVPSGAGTAAFTGDGNFENETRFDADGVVKRYRRAERYAAEHAALSLLAGHGIAPSLTHACDTHLVLRMTRVPGRVLHRTRGTAREPDAVLRALAETLTRLHRVPPPPRPTRRGGDAGIRAGWYRRIHQRVDSLPIPAADADTLRDWAARAAARIPRVDRPSLLQHDPKPDNLRWVGDRVVLLDFDQARWGHPMSDLGKLRWRTLPPDDDGDTAWRVFLRHYRRGYRGEFDPAGVDVFRTGHAIGSLAYWFDFQQPAYLPHARSAADLVAVATGVRVPVHALEVTSRHAPDRT